MPLLPPSVDEVTTRAQTMRLFRFLCCLLLRGLDRDCQRLRVGRFELIPLRDQLELRRIGHGELDGPLRAA